MAVELASGYVSLSVKLDGNNGVGKLFNRAQAQATKAGRDTGAAYRRELEAETKKAAEQVEAATKRVVKSRDKEADAAGKLRVATEKLNAAKDKGVKDAGRLAQLEEAQASAKRRHAAAASELARETDALTKSQRRQTDAARAASSAPGPGAGSGGILSRLRAQFSGVGADSGRAFNDAASREMGTGGLSTAAANAGQKVKGGFLSGLGRATALAAPFVGVGAIISKGWGRMVALDNAQAKMRQLGIEGERLDSVMGLINKSVKGTSFGLGDAATVASQALAAGVKEGEDLAQHMQTIVDAAAYGQVPLEEMGTIMNRAKISGKVLSEDLNMLGDRGTPVFAWLAKDLNMSGEALAKFVSDGNLTYEQLNATLQKNAQGAGQRSGETFMGALSNLGAAAGRLGEKILTPIFKPLQQGVVWMTEAFGKISPQVESMIGGLSASIGGFFTGTLLPAFRELWPTIQSTATSLYEGFRAALPTIQSVAGAIAGGFGDAIGFVVRFKDFLIPLVAGLVAYKAAVLVITTITKAWAAVQALLNAAMLLNPIGLVVAAVAALVAGLVLAYNKCDTFRNIVNAAWTGIKTVIGAVWGWLSTSVFPFFKTAFEGIGKAAMWLWENAIQPAWGFIKGAIGLAWEVVSDIFRNWMRVFGIAQTVVMALWENAVKPAWEAIKGAFKAAWDFVSPIFEKFKGAWETLKTGVSGAATAIKEAVTSAFSGLAGIIKAPLKMLGSFLSKIPTSVFGFDIPGADTLNSWGKSLEGLRSGGAIRDRRGLLRGPGTGTSDSILGVNGSGVPIVRVANGEGVVRADIMASGGAEIVAALNAGVFPGLANGGIIQAYNFARAAGDGRKYVYGGTGPDGWDCSGYMSSIYAVLTGQNPNQRYFNTESDFESLGFVRGYQPGAFNIGIRRGGGGPNSHMAGTMPDGTNVESGGSSSTTKFGGDAAGAQDFPLQYFLPLQGNPLDGVAGVSGSLGGVYGGSGGSGGSRGGMTGAQKAQKAADQQQKIDYLHREIEIAEQELADAKAAEKPNQNTIARKELALQKKQDALAKSQAKLDEINSTPTNEGGSGSSKSSGNDPFSKILDGFGELAQTGLDGAVEGLLPPGFDNPMEWPMMKSAGGVLGFIGSLFGEGNPAGGIFSALGAGMTGDASGAVSAIGSIFNPAASGLGDSPAVPYDDAGGAYADGSAGPPGVNGVTSIDNSVSVGANATMDMTGAKTEMNKAQLQQQRKTLPNNGRGI